LKKSRCIAVEVLLVQWEMRLDAPPHCVMNDGRLNSRRPVGAPPWPTSCWSEAHQPPTESEVFFRSE